MTSYNCYIVHGIKLLRQLLTLYLRGLYHLILTHFSHLVQCSDRGAVTLIDRLSTINLHYYTAQQDRYLSLTVVIQQLLDQIHVGQNHSAAAIAL
jgi:hypothetical protein